VTGTVNGEAGEVVVPAGNPESVTSTEPLKPFCPATEAVKVEPDDPALAVSAIGERARLKSCGGTIVNIRGAA
jgi:hypothetical protein